jgi:hypothetical protein
MPRRKTFRGPRSTSGGGYSAPQPIANVRPAIDVAGLNRTYAWMAVDRLLGMQLATEWYGSNVTYLLIQHPLTAENMKRYEKGRKATELGNQGTTEGEKIAAWGTALRTFEAIWPGAKLPTLAEAEKLTTVDPHVTNVMTVLGNLKSAFNGLVTFQPTMESERDVVPGTVKIPLRILEGFVTEPPLKLALSEVTGVATAASMTTVDGETSMDGNEFMSNLPTILDGVYTWAATLNGNLSKPLVKVTTPSVLKARRTPGALNVRIAGAMQKALDMLRTGGVTAAAVSAATGWNEDSVRWNISQVMKRKMNLTVSISKNASGEKIYTVQ